MHGLSGAGLRPGLPGRRCGSGAGRPRDRAAERCRPLVRCCRPRKLDPTIHAHATAELLLDRYGVVTRGSVMPPKRPGGFGLMYKVLAQLEEAGRCRRGYFIEHLGAAQFAVSRHG